MNTLMCGTSLADLSEGYTISENGIEIEILLNRLIQEGVWDRAREQMLQPLIPLIRKTWEKLVGETGLMTVMTCQNQDGSKWAHHMLLRNTNNGYLLQSLASNCHEAATPLLMHVLNMCRGKPAQSWYPPFKGNGRPGYSERMMGMKASDRICRKLSPDYCRTDEYQYLLADPVPADCSRHRVAVRPVSDSNYAEFLEFLRTCESDVFIRNAELDAPDPFLEGLDEEYNKIGMSRRRYLYLAYLDRESTPSGCLIAYTGPAGSNLRFLERHSHIILPEGQSEDRISELCDALLRKASTHYEGLDPAFIPIVVKEKAAEAFLRQGARFHCLYHRHAIVPDNTDLIDYHLKILGARYEKIERLMKKTTESGD